MSSEAITRNDLTNILNEIVAIDGTDMTAQEIQDFVDSLNVTGINAVDYVVEQGTSGDWTYRKWNSGIGECWCDDTWTTTWSSYVTGLYISGTLTKATPFTFYNPNSTAHVSVNVKTAGSNWGWSAIPRFSTDSLVAFGVVRNGNTGDVSASIYCIGRWKA